MVGGGLTCDEWWPYMWWVVDLHVMGGGLTWWVVALHVMNGGLTCDEWWPYM